MDIVNFDMKPNTTYIHLYHIPISIEYLYFFNTIIGYYFFRSNIIYTCSILILDKQYIYIYIYIYICVCVSVKTKVSTSIEENKDVKFPVG